MPEPDVHVMRRAQIGHKSKYNDILKQEFKKTGPNV